jgi:glutamine amidotransferase
LKQKLVGILDYGVGNVASLKGALERAGYRAVIGGSESQLTDIDILFLPGVGSFDFALENLRSSGLDRYISDRFRCEDLPIVGICLGMQIMFESSEEGNSLGLGLIEGRVEKFDENECHVGWNYVAAKSMKSIFEQNPVYFNHSYKVVCADHYILGETDYQGGFVSMVRSGRFTGLQFHPEKSQKVGEMLLKVLGDEI